MFQLKNHDPKYYADHYTGKCRVADWMRAQESVVSDDSMSWSVLTTGPYMDMLNLVSGTLPSPHLLRLTLFFRASSAPSAYAQTAHASSPRPSGPDTSP